MSWEDMMRRILQPAGRVPPHVTSGYGVTADRPRGSSSPHRGIDFNYVGGREARLNKSNPAVRSPVDGMVETAGEDKWGTIAIRDKNGLLHQIPASADPSQTRQGQSDTPTTEDWSAMWRRRTGLP